MAKIVSASEVLSRKYKLKKASDLNRGPAGRDGRHGLNGMVGPQGPAGPASRDGHDGSDGNGFEGRGTYKPQNTYQPNDVVHYDGSSYICIKTSKGRPPSGAREYWDLMAEAGSHGGGGTSAPAQVSSGVFTWIDYASCWEEEPTLLGTTVEGEVYSYKYTNSTYYRLVPNSNSQLKDSFYRNWSGTSLSDLITTRTINI